MRENRNSEKWLEKEADRRVRQMGGKSEKWGTMSNPDRIFFLPDNIIFFIEFKSYEQTPTPAQKYKIKEMLGFGVRTYVVASLNDLNGIPELKNY